MGDPRAEFLRLFMRNTTLATAAAHYGLTAEEMGLALHYARVSKIINKPRFDRPAIRPPAAVNFDPPPPVKVWCVQCDRNVFLDEAERCTSQFCKARAMA
jgi:hypothetical protein